jgi:acyl-CoA thioester hydrolase
MSPEPPEPPPPHEHRLRVRYGETDQMGVAHHANYLLYMEDGRTRLMESLGCSYAELERRGWGLPVRRAEVRYRASAAYDEELVVRTRVGRLRGASVTFEYEVLRAADDRLLATGSTELACVRLDGERRPQLLPPELRALLEPDQAG